MQDKRIRFSAEENVRPILRGLSEESSKLGRKLIEDARAYTTSSKETLKYIEEQIRAKERLIALESKGARVELEKAHARGDVRGGEAGYRREIKEIGLTDKYAQQQVGLLRELINTIKNESQKEIREDRKGVEQTIKASKTVEQLDPKGDPEKILKETIQRAELGDIKTTEREEKEKFRYGKVLQRGSGIIGGAAGSRNQFYMAAAALAVIPFVGVGASQVANKAFSAAERYQEGLGGMSALTGREQSTFYDAGGDLTDIGYTKAPFLELQRRTAIARGSAGKTKKERKELEQKTRDVAFLERGTRLDTDIFLEQEKLTRAGGLGARAGTLGLVKGLQGVGVIKDKDLSLLGEYLPILVNLQKEQVKITGETNNEIANKLIPEIASLDESFQNPTVLREVISSVMGGLRQSSSPQVEAYKFRVLSRMDEYQGASFVELKKAMEQPTPAFIKAMRSSVIADFGAGDVGTLMTQGIYSTMSTSEAERYNQGISKKVDKSLQIGFDPEKRAEFATGGLRKGTALFTEKFETVGQALTNAIQTLTGVFPEIKEGLETLNKAIKSDTEAKALIVNQLELSGNKVAAAINRLPISFM